MVSDHEPRPLSGFGPHSTRRTSLTQRLPAPAYPPLNTQEKNEAHSSLYSKMRKDFLLKLEVRVFRGRLDIMISFWF